MVQLVSWLLSLGQLRTFFPRSSLNKKKCHVRSVGAGIGLYTRLLSLMWPLRSSNSKGHLCIYAGKLLQFLLKKRVFVLELCNFWSKVVQVVEKSFKVIKVLVYTKELSLRSLYRCKELVYMPAYCKAICTRLVLVCIRFGLKR